MTPVELAIAIAVGIVVGVLGIVLVPFIVLFILIVGIEIIMWPIMLYENWAFKRSRKKYDNEN